MGMHLLAEDRPNFGTSVPIGTPSSFVVTAAIDVAAVALVVVFVVEEFVGAHQPMEASAFAGSQHQLRQYRLL
jgi:hypothetical protein